MEETNRAHLIKCMNCVDKDIEIDVLKSNFKKCDDERCRIKLVYNWAVNKYVEQDMLIKEQDAIIKSQQKIVEDAKILIDRYKKIHGEI